MADTRGVGDDKRGTGIAFSLTDGLYGLVIVCAHSDLCYIHIAIAHGHACQVFLAGALSAGRKFCSGAGRGRLGGLTACIGINLRIKYQDIDILTAGKNVIQSAEADIIGPSVASENPLGLLGEAVFFLQDPGAPLHNFLGTATCCHSAQRCSQGIGCCCIFGSVPEGIQPFFCSLRQNLLTVRAGSAAVDFLQ